MGVAPLQVLWRCFLVKRGGCSPPTCLGHSFRRTYNLTRVLMSVANKYSNDRRQAQASLSGGSRVGRRERDGGRGEALLAKYLGGQSGGGRGWPEDGRGGVREPGARRPMYWARIADAVTRCNIAFALRYCPSVTQFDKLCKVRQLQHQFHRHTVHSGTTCWKRYFPTVASDFLKWYTSKITTTNLNALINFKWGRSFEI